MGMTAVVVILVDRKRNRYLVAGMLVEVIQVNLGCRRKSVTVFEQFIRWLMSEMLVKVENFAGNSINFTRIVSLGLDLADSYLLDRSFIRLSV